MADLGWVLFVLESAIVWALASRWIKKKVSRYRFKKNSLKVEGSSFLSCYPEILIQTDLNGDIDFVNDNGMASLGITNQRLLKNMNVIDLCKNSSKEKIKMILASVCTGQKCAQAELVMLVNGNNFHVIMSACPVVDNCKTVGMRAVLVNINARKEYEHQIKQLAYKDHLTGLPNKMLLEDRVQQAIARAGRKSGMVAVFVADINNFKSINDTLGHMTGDEVIKKVGSRLRAIVRKEDTVARFGGDEFVIVLENIKNKEDAKNACVEINHMFEAPFVVDNHSLKIKLSIGGAIYPVDGHNYETLIRNADVEMFKSKTGR